MTFPCPHWATQKNSVSFLVFSMSHCIYVALAPCFVVHYNMVLICVQDLYMSAIVLKIHVLPYSCFCIQHTQCISCISGVVMTNFIYGIFFFLLLILKCAQPCTFVVPSSCVIFVATISHADCGILFPNLAGPSQMLHSIH